jgi:hypothetical protein
MFGQDIKKVFSQQYLGNINVVPELRLVDNFKAILNPTVKDMVDFLLQSQL